MKGKKSELLSENMSHREKEAKTQQRIFEAETIVYFLNENCRNERFIGIR